MYTCIQKTTYISFAGFVGCLGIFTILRISYDQDLERDQDQALSGRRIVIEKNGVEVLSRAVSVEGLKDYKSTGNNIGKPKSRLSVTPWTP